MCWHVCGSHQAGAGTLVLGAAHPELHLLMSSRELLLETEVGMDTKCHGISLNQESMINMINMIKTKSMMETVMSGEDL